MRFLRCFTLGLASISLVFCLGARVAWSQGHHAAAATDPLSKMNRLPAALEDKVGQFRANVTAKGFAVARGYWTLWGVDDCRYPLQTLGYCYGNNPAAPYVVAMVPKWEDEYRDQRFHHLINEPLRNTSSIYRLDPREAIVIAAELPPPASYFGILSMVATRKAAFNDQDKIISFVSQDPLLEGILYGVSPDPERRMMMASIGNSINNVDIHAQTREDPWRRPAYFVITSDADLAGEMTDALIEAGASQYDIFTEPVSPEVFRLGLDSPADDLITYIRYALPFNTTAGEQWRHDLPLTVMRVRDVTSRVYGNPYQLPDYTERKANFDERTAFGGNNGAFKALQDAVRQRWGQQGTNVTFFSAYIALDLVGQHCLGVPDTTRGPMDCLGDTQDADYQISQSALLDGNVVAVMGVLSTETNNATYTSLSVNWFPELVGVANIDDKDLRGTATTFGTPNAEKFYVYYVARDCRGLSPCLEVSKKLVPTGAIVKFIQRNYVNPGSRNGPDPNKILNPIAIVFTAPALSKKK